MVQVTDHERQVFSTLMKELKNGIESADAREQIDIALREFDAASDKKRLRAKQNRHVLQR